MTTTTDHRTFAMPTELTTLRDVQLFLTAAISHSGEESLEPTSTDKLLGMRLRLEKKVIMMIGDRLDQLDRQH